MCQSFPWLLQTLQDGEGAGWLVSLGLGGRLERNTLLPWIGGYRGCKMLIDDPADRNRLTLQRLDVPRLERVELRNPCRFGQPWTELDLERFGNERFDRFERNNAGLRDVGLEHAGQQIASLT